MLFINIVFIQETVDQLKEFEESLQKSISGNMSLVDQIGGVQLAIQSAIRSSTSPEILNMFIQKQNGSLRSRLAGLESDRRLDKISNETYESQAVEILQMLEKLKEPLSPAEQNLLQKVILRSFFYIFYCCAYVYCCVDNKKYVRFHSCFNRGELESAR